MRRFYTVLFTILKPIAALLLPQKTIGRENVPEGGCIICANHSSMLDAIYLIYGVGIKNQLRFMMKMELLSVPVLRWLLKKIGAFAVDREGSGLGGVRIAMKYLKDGEKVMIFPEGTRVSNDDAVAAKTGAVRLASKFNLPIIPIYIPRKKGFFRRATINIGEPYYVSDGKTKIQPGEFNELSDKLMEKIIELRPETVK